MLVKYRILNMKRGSHAWYCAAQFYSLGNSRFLKTIKATLDKERFVIMKIFVKHDSTQKLDSQLERIQSNYADIFN
jgi:hypothetical protein